MYVDSFGQVLLRCCCCCGWGVSQVYVCVSVGVCVCVRETTSESSVFSILYIYNLLIAL